MKKTILALALALTSFAGSANAGQTFNWSFTGNTFLGGIQSNDDQISGILELNDQKTEAISMIVTSVPSGNIKFNSQNFAFNAFVNSFSVSNGNITQASFSSGIDFPPINGIEESYKLVFNLDYYDGNPVTYYSYFAQNNNTFTSQENFVVNRSGGLSAINFSPTSDPTAVPEPSTYALFGLGALVLIVAYRRKVA